MVSHSRQTERSQPCYRQVLDAILVDAAAIGQIVGEENLSCNFNRKMVRPLTPNRTVAIAEHTFDELT